MDTTPKVSVCICAYNAASFIEKTVVSVLNQTYKNIEILILDNASSDTTVEIINNIKHHGTIKLYKSDTNLGAYAGINYLLSKSSGEYVAINDHDDIWHLDKLQMQVEFLENNNEFIGCGTGCIVYYEKCDKFISMKRKARSKIAMHPSLVFRNKGFRYDNTITYKTDQYFMRYILCRDKRAIFNLPEPLFIHRIRKDGNNLNNKWRTIPNVITYFKRTHDIQKMIFGIVRSILPMNAIETALACMIGKNIKDLKANSFTKMYFDVRSLPL